MVVGTKLNLEQKILSHCIKFTQSGYFRYQEKKENHCHRIQVIQVSLGTKFYFKKIISRFCTKFRKKGVEKCSDVKYVLIGS